MDTLATLTLAVLLNTNDPLAMQLLGVVAADHEVTLHVFFEDQQDIHSIAQRLDATLRASRHLPKLREYQHAFFDAASAREMWQFARDHRRYAEMRHLMQPDDAGINAWLDAAKWHAEFWSDFDDVCTPHLNLEARREALQKCIDRIGHAAMFDARFPSAVPTEFFRRIDR